MMDSMVRSVPYRIRAALRGDLVRVFLPFAAMVAAAIMVSTLFLSSRFIAGSTRILQEQEVERLNSAMRLFSRINLGSVPTFMNALEEPTIRDYLYGRQWSKEKTLRGLERIDLTTSGNEFVDSLYLYNVDAGVLSTRSGWEGHDDPSDPDLMGFLSRVREYGLSRYVVRRVAFVGDAVPRNLFTIVLGSMPPPGSLMRYAFVANLSERRIRAALAGDGLQGSSMYIVDAERRFLSHPDAERFGTPVGDDPRFAPVLDRPEPEGTTVVRDGAGKRWIASWSDHPEIMWRFVTLAPERLVFAPVLRVRDLVVVVTAAVMAAAIILAFVLSLRMSERSRRAESELSYLRGEIEGAARLRGLFPGMKGPAYAAVVLVDGYLALIRERGAGTLYGAGAALRDALAARCGAAEVLRLSDSAFVALFGAEKEDPRTALSGALAEVGGGIVSDRVVSFGAYLLPTPVVVDAFPDAFRVLRDAARNDYLRNPGEIVDAAGGSAAQDGAGQGPSDKAEIDFSRIEKAFRLDDPEEALRQVSSFAAALRAAADADLFRYAVSTLGRRVPELLGADAETLLPGGADGYRTALSRSERLREAEDLLRSAASRLKERGGLHAERRQRDAVERAKAIIEERISDHALSTAAIAAEVGLSASYLRDLFKRMEGVALLEYVGSRRLELAKRLLSGSDASVREICDRAGFINYSYFFTYFKKATGRTPTEFREETVRK
jgi:AraC-like DNA-binding protein